MQRRHRAGRLQAPAGRAAAVGFSARALPAGGRRVRLVGGARVGTGPSDDRAGRAVRRGLVPAVREGRLRPALLHPAPGSHAPPHPSPGSPRPRPASTPPPCPPGPPTPPTPSPAPPAPPPTAASTRPTTP